MAEPKVTIELTVAEHQAVMNLLNVANAFKNIDTAARGMGVGGAVAGDKLDKGFNAVTSTINRAVKAFLSLNMGMQAFHALVTQVKAELTDYEKRGQAQKGYALSRGEAIMEAKTQLGTGRTTSTGKPFTSADMVSIVNSQIAGRPGMNEKGIYNALAGAYASSSAAEIPADILSAFPARVLETMPQYGLDTKQEEFADVVTGVIRIYKAIQSENRGTGKRASIDEAIAAFKQFQDISPARHAEEFAKAPASLILNMVRNYGEKSSNAAALVSTIQQQGVDEQGRRAATNLLSTTADIKAMMPDLPELAGMTPDQAIEYMAHEATPEKNMKLFRKKAQFLGPFAQGIDPKLLKQLKAGKGDMTGDMRYRAIIAALYDPESETHKLYEANKLQVAGATSPEKVAQQFAEFQKNANAPESTVVMQELYRQASEQGQNVPQTEDVKKTQVMSMYEEAMVGSRRSAGISFLGDFIRKPAFKYWSSGNMSSEQAAEAAIGKLEERKQAVNTYQSFLESMREGGSQFKNFDLEKRVSIETLNALNVAITQLNAYLQQERGVIDVRVTNPPDVPPPPTNPIEPGS
jgi:hypothetical protein